MVDEEVVRARLDRLETALRHLTDLAASPREEFVSSWPVHGLAERALETAAQSCLDIASHLVSAKGLRAPTGYGDTFQILAEEGLIPAELAGAMKEIAALRNLLVHEYMTVDHARLHDLIQDTSSFRSFAAAVRKIVWG